MWPLIAGSFHPDNVSEGHDIARVCSEHPFHAERCLLLSTTFLGPSPADGHRGDFQCLPDMNASYHTSAS